MWLADAREELLELAESTEIPVVKTMMGLSLLPTDHPLNMGMIGTHGNHCANQALAKADLLIMVGTRAADRAVVDPGRSSAAWPPSTSMWTRRRSARICRPPSPLVGNVKVILRQILDRGAPVTNSAAWLEQLTDYRRAELNRRFPRREGYVFPGTVLRKLGTRLDDDAVVCVDVGQNQIFTCKYLPQKNGRLLTSGGLGTMGYALPAAVGAKVACPERQTIVVCGDGSFQMAMNELAAVRAGGLDLKIVLFRNHTLGLVHQIQCSAPITAPSAWPWTAPRILRPSPRPMVSQASPSGTRTGWTASWTSSWPRRAAAC